MPLWSSVVSNEHALPTGANADPPRHNVSTSRSESVGRRRRRGRCRHFLLSRGSLLRYVRVPSPCLGLSVLLELTLSSGAKSSIIIASVTVQADEYVSIGKDSLAVGQDYPNTYPIDVGCWLGLWWPPAAHTEPQQKGVYSGRRKEDECPCFFCVPVC